MSTAAPPLAKLTRPSAAGLLKRECLFAPLKPPFVLVFDNCQDAPPGSPFHAIIDGALHALPPGG
jgi:hypothetical protein